MQRNKIYAIANDFKHLVDFKLFKIRQSACEHSNINNKNKNLKVCLN